MGKGVWKDERRFTFRTIRAGQPRPYADHHNVYEISVEFHPLGKDADHETWVPNDLNETIVRPVAKAFCKWVDNPTNPFETRLAQFTKVGPGLWRVETKATYTG